MTVYIMQALGTDRVKIGHTKGNPYKRLDDLQTGCPFKLDILVAIPGEGKPFEKKLHRLFKKYRIHGEWFYYRPAIYAYVRAYEKRLDEEAEIYYQKQYESYEKELEAKYDRLLENEMNADEDEDAKENC